MKAKPSDKCVCGHQRLHHLKKNQYHCRVVVQVWAAGQVLMRSKCGCPAFMSAK